MCEGCNMLLFSLGIIFESSRDEQKWALACIKKDKDPTAKSFGAFPLNWKKV